MSVALADSGFACPLTLERMKEAVIAPCGHTFERSAIREWVAANGFCPLCRSPMSLDTQLVPNLALRDVLDIPLTEEVGLECKCVRICTSPSLATGNLGDAASNREEDQSEYEEEEVEEVVGHVDAPSRQPLNIWGSSTPQPSRGINPFTGEFDDGGSVYDTACEGLLCPLRPPTPPRETIIVRRRVKRDRAVGLVSKPAESAECSKPVNTHTLIMEVLIHNLSASVKLPSCEVFIPDTVLTWRGVSSLPAIPPQGSERIQLRLKLKEGVDPTRVVWDTYTVFYRGKDYVFPFDASLFVQPLRALAPVTKGLECFNILVFGVAGCGKSSFINKVATLMDGSPVPTTAFAPTGGGERHITKKLIAYHFENSHITIWDTWGFNANYRDDTLAYIFEGRLPSYWRMGEIKRAEVGSIEESLAVGSPTAFTRRIHGAILMISIDDLEDPYQCRLIADRFHSFKEFSPILVVNKVDKPFTDRHGASGYSSVSWLRPWVPPAISTAVASAVAVSATVASTAATWVGDTATRAHEGYQQKGWQGVVDPSVFVHRGLSPPSELEPMEPLPAEESRPHFSRDSCEGKAGAEFDVVSHREAASSLPFWANSESSLAVEIRRVVARRCHVSPNSIFLNVNYVEQSGRNVLMDLQTLSIMQEALRRAQLFEERYGSPDAILPHELQSRVAGDNQQAEWKWS